MFLFFSNAHAHIHTRTNQSIQVNDSNTVLVNEFDGEFGKVDDKSHLQLSQAFLEQFLGSIHRQILLIVAIQETHGEEGGVSMCSERQLIQRGQVVDPIEFWTHSLSEASDEHVDAVRILHKHAHENSHETTSLDKLDCEDWWRVGCG